MSPGRSLLTHAHLLPLRISGSSMQAVLVSGLSPRLPFDNAYQTFLQVIGERIAGLLQSEVHQMERAQAARRFSRLADANPFGMVIGSLGGQLDYVNPAFLKTLGYSAEDVSSGKVRWDDLTPPEYAQADANAVRQLLASGRCDVLRYAESLHREEWAACTPSRGGIDHRILPGARSRGVPDRSYPAKNCGRKIAENE